MRIPESNLMATRIVELSRESGILQSLDVINVVVHDGAALVVEGG